MYSDTHCHLSHIQERGEDLTLLLSALSDKKFRFVFDIGTKIGDLDARLERIRTAADGDIPGYLHFSCGLWPDNKIIADRMNALAILKTDIVKMLDLCKRRSGESNAIQCAALGECGLDRFWNGPQAAARISGELSSPDSDDGPGTTDIAGEEELFGLQLDMAKAFSLAVIVHSRSAFDATLGTIRNGGWDKGVIHCYSYGVREARAFLDRGWYISFPGNITWAKKEADCDRIAELLRYIPRDRLLLETDGPYMAPSPHRGKTNTPLLIEHTYDLASSVLEMKKETLALLVYDNALSLFAR